MSVSFKRLFLLAFFILLVVENSFSQALSTGPSILARGKATKKEILIRWVPSTPMVWEESNAYGYAIERYSLSVNGQLVDSPESVKLNDTPIKPFPLDNWESLVTSNSYAAVAAQAIYGETFEIDYEEGNQVIQIINKVKEQEARYSYALFAADQSLDVAKASGLYYKDEAVDPDTRYLYKIYSLTPDTPVDTAYIYVGLNDYTPLPEPFDVSLMADDKIVQLKWDQQILSKEYSSYVIERSEDSISYETLNAIPIVPIQQQDFQSAYMYYNDTIPENGKKYYYRIYGKSYFGESGPPSEVFTAIGVPRIGYFPDIIDKENVDNNSAKVVWEVPENELHLIRSFEMQRSLTSKGGYHTLKELEPVINGEYLDTDPALNNYYRLKMNANSGEVRYSMPVLVQLVDSVPPVIPAELRSDIDINGLISISWNENPDEDIRGYRIYKSNSASQEFSQLTQNAEEQTTYTDSLNLSTLQKRVFYRVVAEDLRGNLSEMSEILEVKLPDMVPPTTPLFSKVTPDTESVTIEWVPSSSKDVNAHILYRKAANSQKWQLIHVSEGVTNFFRDTDLQKGVKYYYTLIAVDDSKLESKPAAVVSATLVPEALKKGPEKLYSDADAADKLIRLGWSFESDDLKSYRIYRSSDNSEWVMIEETEDNLFIDNAVKRGETYFYRVQAKFTDGSVSVFSKPVKASL